MATKNSKHNVSPSLAYEFTTSSGIVAAHYDCPCGICIAGPSTYNMPPYGGKLPFCNGTQPPSFPYIEDTRQTITIIPPSGPYFLNGNVSFFSVDSLVEQQQRGLLRSSVSHVRAIAYKAKASLNNIWKPQRQSNRTTSNDTRLPPKYRSGEIACGDSCRGIQNPEIRPVGLKRRMTTKENVKRWIHTSETEPISLKCGMPKEKAKRWIETSEPEPMALKRKI